MGSVKSLLGGGALGQGEWPGVRCCRALRETHPYPFQEGNKKLVKNINSYG
jgi:hypothetical protein